MSTIFKDEDTDAVLLVDATNAFNQLNRQAALHNISVLCPSFSTILRNTYGTPIRLFVTGEGEISSTEGTTGDPLAMGMYAVAITPLIHHLRQSKPDLLQDWFADDATAAGSFDSLLMWWAHLQSIGPLYGTCQGERHLGAALGDNSFVTKYVSNKVKKWTDEVLRLSEIAKTHPHSAYQTVQSYCLS